jgi:hypothetical protein
MTVPDAVAVIADQNDGKRRNRGRRYGARRRDRPTVH